VFAISVAVIIVITIIIIIITIIITIIIIIIIITIIIIIIIIFNIVHTRSLMPWCERQSLGHLHSKLPQTAAREDGDEATTASMKMILMAMVMGMRTMMRITSAKQRMRAE
jgi:hypothetical protein